MNLASPGLPTGHLDDADSFEDVFETFMRQWFRQIDSHLQDQVKWWSRARANHVTAAITAGTFASVLRTGLDPLRGGVDIPEQMIFLNSIPTVGDCLAAMRRVVYGDKACTLSQLRDALAADWEGFETLRQRCRSAPKFGNDDDAVDDLVVEIVRRSSEHVKAHSAHMPFGVWPCLFNHTFIPVAQSCGATPDGRKWMDPVAEHFSPTPGCAVSGPTAVIRSAAKAPLRDCIGVAILHVGLSRSMAPRSEEGRSLVRSLMRAALELGVTQFNTAIYDIEQLKDAQIRPERHQDLIVRVWGFSARFVSLAKEMQDHIIARAIRPAAG